MLEYLRHHQKSVLLVVTVVVCITFGWFYVKSDTGHGQGENVVLGNIYGREIRQRDYRKMEQHTQVAGQLQLPGFELLTRGLAGDSLMTYLSAIMMVREESAKLGLAVTPEEAEAYLTTLPAFQTNGQFDPAKFALYAGTGADDGLSIPIQFNGQMFPGPPVKLSRLGLSVGDLREIVADFMLLGKLQELLGAGLTYSDTEAERDHAQSRQKIKASVIRIPFSRFKEAIQITDEEILKAYEEKKTESRFMTEQKKAIEFVAIKPEKIEAPTLPPPPATEGQPPPPPPAPPAEPADKAQDRQKLANDIYNGLQDKSLAELVAAANEDPKLDLKTDLTIETTEPFATAAVPEALKDKQKLQAAVNRATMAKPEPPPVKEGDVWYVLRLTQVIEPVSKPLEEVKTTLTDELRDAKAQEAAKKSAAEVYAKLKPLIEGGRSFADAATEVGEKSEDLPAIASSMNTSPDDRIIARALTTAKPGSLGKEPLMADDAMVIPWLIAREIEKSPTKGTDISGMKDGMTNQLRQTIFYSWWLNRMEAAEFVDLTKSTAPAGAGG